MLAHSFASREEATNPTQRSQHRLQLLFQGQVFARWCSEKLTTDFVSCAKGKFLPGGVHRNSPQASLFLHKGKDFQVVCRGPSYGPF